MTFYLKSPQGVLSLCTLQTCVRERFQYLQALMNDEEASYTPKNFDYLIEGTAMDRAGHFLLRLISLSSPRFQEFVVIAETKFFLLRLNASKSSQEIRAFLKLLHRHAVECSSQPKLTKSYHQFLVSAKHMCEKMMIKSVAAHSFNGRHSHSCTEYALTMHFTMCLPMVQERKVDLHGGNAYIPCGKWKQLLALFFQRHIQLGMTQLHAVGCFDSAICDPRIKELIIELGGKFKCNIHTMKLQKQLKATEIKRESTFFPPCMAHLYCNLQAKHRLAHEARRHFTLFLKDAGMPLEEAINYWSEEYSHPHTCGNCKHSWQQDSNRFIYSIRHMYGLEGGRYNYNVPSCRKIQAMSLNSMAEGGCPFVHFDDKRLKDSFHSTMKSNELACQKIMLLKTEQKPREACTLYLSTYKEMAQSMEPNKPICNSFNVTNPIQYYISVKSGHGVEL